MNPVQWYSSLPGRPDGARYLWLLCGIAATSFLPSLFFYYVGEEGLYTIAALVMKEGGDWLVPSVPAGNYGRPPLQIWLVLLTADLLGWENVLIASRLVTLSGTLLTALMLGYFANLIWKDDRFVAFAVLSYLTLFDLLLYRGWLAYSDSMFGCLVFSAMCLAWIAAHQKNHAVLLAGLAALSLAFLTKALTAYVFYAGTVFVLGSNSNHRRFLLGVPSVLCHLAAFAVPLAWFHFLPGNAAQGTGMLGEIARKFSFGGLGEYFLHVLGYPLDILVRLSPPLAIMAYFSWRGRSEIRTIITPEIQRIIWIVALGFLPYWLSPHSHIRYLMPLYPFVALGCAWIIWNLGGNAMRMAMHGIVLVIILKFLFVMALFPEYQRSYRGENYRTAAIDIIELSRGELLYTAVDNAAGVSVVAYIDTLRHPNRPLQAVPEDQPSGLVIARTADRKLGKVVKQYRLGGDNLYLLCRGAACGERRD